MDEAVTDVVRRNDVVACCFMYDETRMPYDASVVVTAVLVGGGGGGVNVCRGANLMYTVRRT